MAKFLFQKGHKINLGKKFKKKGIYNICPTCQKEFYVYRGQSKRRRYCSKKCQFSSDSWKKDISIRQKARVMTKQTRKKISDTCKRKGIYPVNAYQGGKSFEEYTVNWTKTLKISIRERDRYTCQICGERQGDRALDVHHINYDKKNCNPINLISLCMDCHRKTNHHRDYWEKYFYEAGYEKEIL